MKKLLLLTPLFALIACAQPAPTNSVVAFLTGAERQAETKRQKIEIARALRDTLELPTSELQKQRYKDYTGHKNAWSAPELLTHYYVPPKPTAPWANEAAFYQDAATPEGKATLKATLTEVEHDLSH